MKYKLLTLLAITLLLFSPALAEMPEAETEPEDSAQEEQIAIDAPTLTQGMAGEEITRLQQKLNAQYDDFSRQYGLISSTANRRAFQQDSSYCLLAALEVLDENGQLKRKADIFTKRTIRKPEPVESVDTASEALALAIAFLQIVL